MKADTRVPRIPSLFDSPFEEPAPEPAPTPAPEQPAVPPAQARQVLTVSALTTRLRLTLEGQFTDVWVEGELSNCRVWNTGHMYFTLKDPGAQLKGVMFRTAHQRLRFTPQDGLRVVARGRISVYDPKGEYQIVCEHLEPEGVGARQLAFEQLKQRLAAAGLFDPARKRPLPALPRKIGVVTSLDGAAVRDIVNVLRRRYANAHIVIRPTRVQGEGAAVDIARGITAIARVPGVDVVIVGRGGGSVEDLWAFNEEIVAHALAGCACPTISAVGHETDVTIADFVADLRAPTPSAAAELVVARKDDYSARIERLGERLHAALRGRLHRIEAHLRTIEARPGYAGLHGHVAMHGRYVADLTHALRRTTHETVTRHERRLQRLRLQLERFDLRRRIGVVRLRLTAADSALDAAMRARHHRAATRVQAGAARLGALSPLAVLGRGYAVCWTADRARAVRDASEVRPGDAVRVTLHRGELTCQVTDHE